MPIRYVAKPPTQVVFTPGPDDVASRLNPDDVETVAEIFRTPLTGAYCWDYGEADRRIRKLYRLGKQRNWNAELNVDWTRGLERSEWPVQQGSSKPYKGWEPIDRMSEAERIELSWHIQTWMMSQFLHGEQGALLVSSQLVSCAPSHDAKLYAASQTFDEARHVEAFGRYVHDHAGFMYPVNRHLKALLDKIMTDERWDLKFIGMQLIIEALALAALNLQRAVSADPLLLDVIDLVVRDEARHVAFGVNYLEDFVKTLTPEEREQRAQFAFEACRVMRERIVPTDVFEHYGMDVEEGRKRFLAGGDMDRFRNLLFMRILPNLDRVGLLTESVKPKFAELGLLEFAGLPNDGEIDWAALEAPIPEPRSIPASAPRAKRRAAARA